MTLPEVKVTADLNKGIPRSVIVLIIVVALAIVTTIGIVAKIKHEQKLEEALFMHNLEKEQQVEQGRSRRR